MAITKIINIKVNVDVARQNVEELNRSFDLQQKLVNELERELNDYEKKLTKTSKTDLAGRKKVNDSIKDTTQKLKDEKLGLKQVTQDRKKANKELAKTVKESKKSAKGFNLMKKGLKAVGVGFKALGIGLIVSLVAGLTEAFSRNKKIMDSISIILGTVGNVFSQITDALVNTYEAVSKSSENFDALGKVLGGILGVVINPLKFAFFSIKLGIQESMLAWENSFLGGKDAEKIKELNADILETKSSIVEVAEDFVKAGSDIVDNFSEAVGEVSNISTIATEELSKVNIKSANEQAKSYTKAKENSVIAQAESSKLIAKYEREQEIQRQIRDNVNLSLEERQEANDKLLNILSEQETELLKNADLQIQLASLELQRNNSAENQAALIQAQAEKQQILADITGKTSEQEVNRVALLNEEVDLMQTITDSENERNKIQSEFEAEREVDPLKKLQLQKEALDQENKLILEDIEKKRLLYAEGTQARVDAEEQYKNQKQAIDNAITVNEDEQGKQREADAKAVEDAKIGIANAGLNVLGAIAEEGSALSKGVAVAQATMNTYQGITAALSSTSTVPDPLGQALKVANAISVGVMGLMNVKKILATKPVEKTAPNISLGAGGGAPAVPSFNLVEGSADNQIANSLNEQNQQPIKAFVVTSDVTTGQELDRNIIDNSSL